MRLRTGAREDQMSRSEEQQVEEQQAMDLMFKKKINGRYRVTGDGFVSTRYPVMELFAQRGYKWGG